MTFAGLDGLIAQIRRDETEAREILADVPLTGFSARQDG